MTGDDRMQELMTAMDQSMQRHRNFEDAAWYAYAPLEELIALRNTSTYVRARDAGDDMRAWMHAYRHRTEPTWNERLIRQTHEGGTYTTRGHGLMHLASVDRSQCLTESSAHTGRIPGWFTVRPTYEREPGCVPHMMINRVYPEGDERELVYLSSTYSHPSREYAQEIARQLLTGEVKTWLWRNIHTGLGYTLTHPKAWRMRSVHELLEGVEVCEITPHGQRDLVFVDHDYLRARGQAPS